MVIQSDDPAAMDFTGAVTCETCGAQGWLHAEANGLMFARYPCACARSEDTVAGSPEQSETRPGKGGDGELGVSRGDKDAVKAAFEEAVWAVSEAMAVQDRVSWQMGYVAGVQDIGCQGGMSDEEVWSMAREAWDAGE